MGEGFQRAIAKPPDGLRPLVVPERHETVTYGGYAAALRLLSQKAGILPQKQMVEDIAAEAPAEMAGAFRLGCCTEGMGYLFGIMDRRRTDGG